MAFADFLRCRSEARHVFNAMERVGADILAQFVHQKSSQRPRRPRKLSILAQEPRDQFHRNQNAPATPKKTLAVAVFSSASQGGGGSSI